MDDDQLYNELKQFYKDRDIDVDLDAKFEQNNLISLSFNQTEKIEDIPLPSILGDFIHLKKLELSGIDLSNNFPSFIGDLKSLDELVLANCSLQTLPNELYQLTSLSSLDLSSNPLKSLPDQFYDKMKLEELLLDNNDIEHLDPGIGKLTTLRKLSINNNKLVTLPAIIGRLSNLETLSVTNNHIKTLPGDIGKLEYLKSLDLSHNEIPRLPRRFSQLNGLDQISVDNNQITRIPAFIGEVSDKPTSKVEIGNNPIMVIDKPNNDLLRQSMVEIIPEVITMDLLEMYAQISNLYKEKYREHKLIITDQDIQDTGNFGEDTILLFLDPNRLMRLNWLKPINTLMENVQKYKFNFSQELVLKISQALQEGLKSKEKETVTLAKVVYERLSQQQVLSYNENTNKVNRKIIIGIGVSVLIVLVIFVLTNIL